MSVYFAETTDGKYIKIGHSGDVVSRIRAIQRNAPYGPSRLCACIKGGGDLEKKIHAQFAHLRKEGEWFQSSNELRLFMDGLDAVKPTTKYVPVNVRLPAPLYRKLKQASEETGMFTQAILAAALQEYLSIGPKRRAEAQQ